MFEEPDRDLPMKEARRIKERWGDGLDQFM
jgi:hypothetical protein